MVYSDDWTAVSRYWADVPRDRVDDAMAQLTVDGPLLTGEAPASTMKTSRVACVIVAAAVLVWSGDVVPAQNAPAPAIIAIDEPTDESYLVGPTTLARGR